MQDHAQEGASMDRRSALAALGLAGFAAAAGGAPGLRPLLSATDLGWDAEKGEYVLPPLPYDAAALEPHIDAETMRIHHGKHHAGYVAGLNAAIARLGELRGPKTEPALLQHWQRQLSFHAGGHFNHTLFWRGMAPAEGGGGGGAPTGTLREAIDASFGAFDAFLWQFMQAAVTVEASGWAWLVLEPVSGRLMVSQMENQQKLLIPGAVPLLGVDVWEHAYYLRYQNRRMDYVGAFLRVINWPEVQRRLDAARGA